MVIETLCTHQVMLRERMQLLLATVPAEELRADIRQALCEKGKLLASPPYSESPGGALSFAGSWGLLAYLVCLHVAPEIDVRWASTVGVAVECFLCSLDLLDDVEDGDSTPIIQELGEPRVLNSATGLLFLVQRALLGLAAFGMPYERVFLLLDTLQSSALLAAAGQQRDLLAERREASELSYDDCLAIAREKAGSLMCLACRLGAQCGGANEKVTHLFSTFGENLGIAHQLDNDAHDLFAIVHPTQLSSDYGPATMGKTDLVRGKKTLPVVFAASRASLQQLAAAADDSQQISKHLLEKGIVATWGICQLYRKRAQQVLAEIEALRRLDPELRLLLGLD